MHFLKITLTWFHALSLSSKRILITGFIMAVVTITFLCIWMTRISFGVLFAQLDSENMGHIIKQLDTLQIPWKIDKQGNTLLVPENLIAKTRIAMMDKGIQFSGASGFELFDKSDFGMTDFSWKINFQRALQGELERTINSLEEVRLSRVHLMIPENRLFEDQHNPPKAAVTLQLKRALTPAQIGGIQQLIKASVPKLDIRNIVLIDQRGNNLTPLEEDPATEHFALKKSMESWMTDKVARMLDALFEPGLTQVQISVSLNHDQRELEWMKPDQQAIVSHEKEIVHSRRSEKEKTPESKDITREKTYQPGHQREHIVQASGTIEKLSVSVILPKNIEIQEVERIREMVKSVVGFSEKRGDRISIEALIPPPPKKSITQSIKPFVPEKSRYVPHFELTLIPLFAASAALLIRYQKRRKKREVLLQELIVWLNQYEK